MDAAGFCGCAETWGTLAPGGPWLREAHGCRGDPHLSPSCPHNPSTGSGLRWGEEAGTEPLIHPRLPGEGGSAPSIRRLTRPRAGGALWRAALLTSCERGRSRHRRATMRGKVLSAWALLASLAAASWGVRGESAGVGSAAGHLFLEMLGGVLARSRTA